MTSNPFKWPPGLFEIQELLVCENNGQNVQVVKSVANSNKVSQISLCSTISFPQQFWQKSEIPWLFHNQNKFSSIPWLLQAWKANLKFQDFPRPFNDRVNPGQNVHQSPVSLYMGLLDSLGISTEFAEINLKHSLVFWWIRYQFFELLVGLCYVQVWFSITQVILCWLFIFKDFKSLRHCLFTISCLLVIKVKPHSQLLTKMMTPPQIKSPCFISVFEDLALELHNSSQVLTHRDEKTC